MHTQENRANRLSKVFSGLLVCVATSGCQLGWSGQRSPSADSAYDVQIDRSANGAAVARAQSDEDAARVLPRSLSFEMTGRAKMPELGATQRQRAAAGQAAAIEAFCNALIEARRSRGQSDSDFTTTLGSRLTVTHCTLEDGHEIHVTLFSQGAETTFAVRNGELQHLPHDLGLLRQVFEETNGEFSLLGMEWSTATGEAVAMVGCYLPKGLDTVIAYDVPVEDTPDVTP